MTFPIKRVALVVGCIAANLFCLPMASADPPAAAPAQAPAQELDAVRQYKASVERLKRFAWTAEERSTMTRSPDGATVARRSYLQAARDGDNWDVLTQQMGDRLVDGELQGVSDVREFVRNGLQVLNISSKDPSLRTRRFDSAKEVPLPSTSASLEIRASLGNAFVLGDGYAASTLGTGSLMFGNLNYADYLPERLTGAKLDPDKQRAELPDCVAVTATGTFGTITAWLDARHGHLPARIELCKRGEDLIGDLPVNKLPPLTSGGAGPAARPLNGAKWSRMWRSPKLAARTSWPN